MNDLDMFMARTQARLAFFLVIILVILAVGVGVLLFAPTFKPEQAIIGLIIQVVTGVLALAGSAVAFFFARHRPPTAGDNETGANPVVPPSQPPETPK